LVIVGIKVSFEFKVMMDGVIDNVGIIVVLEFIVYIDGVMVIV
jgi:hypothetical protein